MIVKPSEADWEFAESVHARFAVRPGSQHIATEFSLAHLSALLKASRPKTILEFGAGIGTLTYALLTHPADVAEIVSTECDAYCLEQLELNIPADLKPRNRVVTDMDVLLQEPVTYDLVVFDGGFYDSRETLFMDKDSFCFIEGSRQATRDSVAEQLRKRGLACHLDNHHQGYRYFSFGRAKKSGSGKRKLNFQWRRSLAGCWIGQVEPVDAATSVG